MHRGYIEFGMRIGRGIQDSSLFTVLSGGLLRGAHVRARVLPMGVVGPVKRKKESERNDGDDLVCRIGLDVRGV